MSYDTKSAELTALDGVGDKLSAAISNAETRTASFDGCVMASAAKTCQLTNALPAGAVITGVTITELSGTGDLDIGLSGGAKDDVLDGTDPTVLTTYPVNKVAAGGSEVYVTAVTAAVTIGGYLTFIVK